MDIDELTEAFVVAFYAWCSDEDHGMGGPKWDAMLIARDALEVEREKIRSQKAG